MGLTLAQVSSRTGIASSTLSRAENEKVSLTYDNLIKLHQGLGVKIEDFFTPRQYATELIRPVALRSVTRAGSGRSYRTSRYRYLFVSEEVTSRTMIPVIVTPRARSLEDFGELIAHDGEEYSYVLKGIVEWHSAFYAPLRLMPGDSIYFSCAMPHAYLNAGTGEAQYLSVSSAQSA